MGGRGLGGRIPELQLWLDGSRREALLALRAPAPRPAAQRLEPRLGEGARRVSEPSERPSPASPTRSKPANSAEGLAWCLCFTEAPAGNGSLVQRVHGNGCQGRQAAASGRSPALRYQQGDWPKVPPLPVCSALSELRTEVAFNPGSGVFRVPPSFKMAAAEEDELPLPRLPELFDTSQQLLDEVEVAAEPMGSRAIQEKVSKGLHLLKQASEMLTQLDLFRYGERVIVDRVGNNGYRGRSR